MFHSEVNYYGQWEILVFSNNGLLKWSSTLGGYMCSNVLNLSLFPNFRNCEWQRFQGFHYGRRESGRGWGRGGRWSRDRGTIWKWKWSKWARRRGELNHLPCLMWKKWFWLLVTFWSPSKSELAGEIWVCTAQPVLWGYSQPSSMYVENWVFEVYSLFWQKLKPGSFAQGMCCFSARRYLQLLAWKKSLSDDFLYLL